MSRPIELHQLHATIAKLPLQVATAVVTHFLEHPVLYKEMWQLQVTPTVAIDACSCT